MSQNLPPVVPDGDSSVGSWTTDSGGTSNLYQKIDETILAANDTTDYVKANNDVNNSDYSVTLQDTPEGFVTMTTLNFNVRYRQQGRTNDTYGLQIRIMNGATVLAAADSGGTFQSVAAGITTTSFTNSGSMAFTYVNTAASKTTWDGAVLTLRQTYSQSASKDGGHVEVSTAEVTGTYEENLYAEIIFPVYIAPRLSGGTETYTTDGYRVHTFTSNGTLTFLGTEPVLCEYLVVAGGGGGGGSTVGCGGGGGGGMKTGSALSISANQTITIGAGGAGGANGVKGTNGGDSSIGSLVVSTGGGGGGYETTNGNNGGSGGGAGAYFTAGSAGTGNSGEGHNGGGAAGDGTTYDAGGGGGGAGAVGSAGVAYASGNGGAGSASSISGSSVTYAGGGGGFGFGVTQGSGGSGGGTTGGSNTNAAANTGGGGGAGSNNNSCDGGSGIVIVRYLA